MASWSPVSSTFDRDASQPERRNIQNPATRERRKVSARAPRADRNNCDGSFDRLTLAARVSGPRSSGAGPSRCPVAVGRRRYRRPGRAGRRPDEQRSRSVLARSEFHPRPDADPPSPNDGLIVVRADFGHAIHQNGIADEDIAIRTRVVVDDRIGGPIVIGMLPPGCNIVDRREQRRLMPVVPIVMMPMMPMAAPTRLRTRR